MNRKYLFIAFILLVIIQLYVPAQMILGREEILDNGTEVKFKTAPVDPTDIIRGKYVTLRFENDNFEASEKDEWKPNEDVYVLLKKDAQGFAEIQSFSRNKPGGNQLYVLAKTSYTSGSKNRTLIVDYPFDRLYMEESEAPVAEKIYNEIASDTSQVAYALVSLKDGEAVLKDVFINDVSIKKLVRE